MPGNYYLEDKETNSGSFVLQTEDVLKDSAPVGKVDKE